MSNTEIKPCHSFVTYSFTFLFSNQTSKFNISLKITWQLIKFGENLLQTLIDDDSISGPKADVIAKTQELLKKFTRQHTLLQKTSKKISKKKSTKKLSKNVAENRLRNNKKPTKNVAKDPPEVIQPMKRSIRSNRGKINRYLQSQFVSQFQTQLEVRQLYKRPASKKLLKQRNQ